jgi:hypothetical protein
MQKRLAMIRITTYSFVVRQELFNNLCSFENSWSLHDWYRAWATDPEFVDVCIWLLVDILSNNPKICKMLCLGHPSIVEAIEALEIDVL